jgi:hypothetical protein
MEIEQIKSLTDKTKSGLLKVYEKVLNPLKGQNIKYLELGVFRGGSLLWAEQFFGPKSVIVGFDKRNPQFDSKRIIMEVGEQSSLEDLNRICKRHGPFDVIIDDCSHQYGLTMLSFYTLKPHLKPGGKYYIEDWVAGFNINRLYCGMEKVIGTIVENWNITWKEMRIFNYPTFSLIQIQT